MEFGILSTANIGQKAVIPAILKSEHTVGAIASRNRSRAENVASTHDIPRTYGSYRDLLSDVKLDAVYIPLPNSLHAKWIKQAADAGLHILCEKPLTADAAEAETVAAYCDDQGVTLMEAFMYQYNPRTERVLEIASSELDTIRSVTATFKFSISNTPDDIRLNPKLAGGSIMDVGCYPVSLVRQVLGEPDCVYAYTNDSRDCGVDTEFAGILTYSNGASARISSGFDTPKVQSFRIEATNGYIFVANAFDTPSDKQLSLTYEINGERTVETFAPTDQYLHQIEHFVDSIKSDTQPRTDATEAAANMRIIDYLYASAASGSPIEL